MTLQFPAGPWNWQYPDESFSKWLWRGAVAYLAYHHLPDPLAGHCSVEVDSALNRFWHPAPLAPRSTALYAGSAPVPTRRRSTYHISPVCVHRSNRRIEANESFGMRVVMRIQQGICRASTAKKITSSSGVATESLVLRSFEDLALTCLSILSKSIPTPSGRKSKSLSARKISDFSMFSSSRACKKENQSCQILLFIRTAASARYRDVTIAWPDRTSSPSPLNLQWDKRLKWALRIQFCRVFMLGMVCDCRQRPFFELQRWPCVAAAALLYMLGFGCHHCSACS